MRRRLRNPLDRWLPRCALCGRRIMPWQDVGFVTGDGQWHAYCMRDKP